jgi:hypothetical protein
MDVVDIDALRRYRIASRSHYNSIASALVSSCGRHVLQNHRKENDFDDALRDNDIREYLGQAKMALRYREEATC